MSEARRILLVVSDHRPQGVTEALYALAVRHRPAWIPTEVHLFTTTEGAHWARLALLEPGRRQFQRLRADYGLPPIRFDAETIHVPPGPEGEPLAALDGEAEILAAGDALVRWWWETTAVHRGPVYVVLAAAGEAWSYLVSQVLGVLGRAQDRWFRVHSSAPFNRSGQYFYPTPRSTAVELPDGRLADAREACVRLEALPFVRLRSALPLTVLDRLPEFRSLLDWAASHLQAPELVIDLQRRLVRAGGQLLEMSPADLALYAVFARRAAAGEPPLRAPPKSPPDRVWAQRFLAEYRRIVNALEWREGTERALLEGMDGHYFSQRKSRLNRRLREALGSAARPYLIEGHGRPPVFSLDLPPEAVRFESLRDELDEAEPPEPPDLRLSGIGWL